jgi:N-acetylneuraminate lyase
VNIIAVMSKHGGLAAGKAMMSMLGLDCGPVRPPLRNLSAAELNAFRCELEQVGFPASIPALDGKQSGLVASPIGK